LIDGTQLVCKALPDFGDQKQESPAAMAAGPFASISIVAVREKFSAKCFGGTGENSSISR